ncbi:MAG: hypothetical protein K2K55_01485 [Duncaniella sp.]|nr:hypothetical protein [Duncaniella sp.]
MKSNSPKSRMIVSAAAAVKIFSRITSNYYDYHQKCRLYEKVSDIIEGFVLMESVEFYADEEDVRQMLVQAIERSAKARLVAARRREAKASRMDASQKGCATESEKSDSSRDSVATTPVVTSSEVLMDSAVSELEIPANGLFTPVEGAPLYDPVQFAPVLVVDYKSKRRKKRRHRQ